MIHQHIFAAPKPGLTEAEFQDYWLNVHAVKFASKIKEIKRYKIDLRIPASFDETPVWNGVAEIWLNNPEDQIASLQSPEFLEGARRDEPNWAAFWATLGLDCDSETLKGGTPPEGAVKLLALYKRAEGLSRATYRDTHRTVLAEAVAGEARVLRHEIAFTRDALYAVGEPPFDAVGHAWFDSVEAAEAVIAGATGAALLPSDGGIVRPDQLFPMLTREHWVIGPDPRP